MENLLLAVLRIVVYRQGQHFQSCVKLQQLLVHRARELSCPLPPCSLVYRQHATPFHTLRWHLSLTGKALLGKLYVLSPTCDSLPRSGVSSLTADGFALLPPNLSCLAASSASQSKEKGRRTPAKPRAAAARGRSSAQAVLVCRWQSVAGAVLAQTDLCVFPRLLLNMAERNHVSSRWKGRRNSHFWMEIPVS